MPMIGFIAAATALRLGTLAVSIRNEKRLKRDGATEYHAATTALLALAHVSYYLAAFAEGLFRPAPPDWVTVAGMAIYAFGIGALFWVIAVLGRFWTVKMVVARDHVLVENRLFRAVRHPNYFLNILPELIGLALALHAWGTLLIGLPVYLVILAARIRQEERVMRDAFPGY